MENEIREKTPAFHLEASKDVDGGNNCSLKPIPPGAHQNQAKPHLLLYLSAAVKDQ